MQDGLYINGTLVVDPGGIATTLQGYDLTTPAAIRTSFTNTFTIPDTITMRELTGTAGQLDSASRAPYQVLPARVISGGEIIIDGFCELSSYNGEFSCAVYEEKQNLLERLEAKGLRDLNLSHLDHKLDIETINSLAGKGIGVTYPVIDYGTVTDGQLSPSDLFPAAYVHTLVDTMLSEEGYILTGLADDPLYKRMAIPFVESEAQSRDEQWVKDRTARVTVSGASEVLLSPGALGGRKSFEEVIKFNVDSHPEDLFTDGVLNNFKTNIYSYVCDTDMRLKVTALQTFKLNVIVGAFEIILKVERNGQGVKQAYYSASGPHNPSNTAIETLALEETIECKKGDEVRLHLTARKRTNVCRADCRLYFDQDRSFAGFSPDPTVARGDNWPVARNLPDMSCNNLLLTVAVMLSGYFDVLPRRRQVRFISLSKALEKLDEAVDWSGKVDESQEPEVSYRLGPYAQKNYLRYKPDEADSRLKAFQRVIITNGQAIGYGDGVISCADETLEPATSLFELPFAASAQSKNQVKNYGAPVYIETRTLTKDSGGNVTIQNKSAQPRIILLEPGDTITLEVRVVDENGNTRPRVVSLTPAWFAVRPEFIGKPADRFSLCFDRVGGVSGTEQTLIERYFGGLKQILRRPRRLEINTMLSPVDIATVDFGKLIRLRDVRCGSQQISDGYYLLTKIPTYQDGLASRPVLIGV